ncbi:MAG: DUF1254 domain-containing protein [Pseudomonadota bacterium]
MMRFLGPLAVFIITAVGAHWATLAYAPSVIMDRALATLKDRGVAEHAFTSPVRISPQTQVVVRSSPDMFYSLCRYDLSETGSSLSITMNEWSMYQSLTFFDAETNNYLTLRGTGKTISQTLYGPGTLGEGTKFGEYSPTKRGVILIRRLAPTPELFEAASEIGKGDRCELVTP